MSETVAVPVSRQTRGAPLVAAFMFAHFTHHVSNSLLTPLLPVIRDSFSLAYAQSGLLVSAFSLSMGLSQAPIGFLADRIGSRLVVTAGLVATTLCMLLIGISGAYWQLLVFLVALGLVAGSYHAPAAAVLARAFPSERLGGALGMHTVGGNISFFVTPIVAGGLVATTATWRTPYLAFAVVPLCAALLLALTSPRGSRGEPSPSRRTGGLKEVVGVFRNVGPLLTLVVVFQMLFAATTSFMALYLVDARGFDPAASAFFVAAPFIGALVGSPAGGRLSDRFGRRPVILISLVCMGPLLLLLTLVPTVWLVPVLMLHGLVMSMRMPVVEGLLLDRAPVDQRATTLGAYYLVAQELGGLGAPLLGGLAEVVGMAAAFSGVAVAAAGLSLLVVAVHRRL